MNGPQRSVPWLSRGGIVSAPGSLLLKLTLGEAPENIPSSADVARGAQEAARKMRLGHVDRLLNHFSDHVRITRVYTAAASLGRLGAGHTNYDDLEVVLGLSRTFRVDADHNCCIEDLVDALRQVTAVEQAYPHYLSALPFAMPALSPAPPLPDASPEGDGWTSRRQVRAVEALAYEEGDPSVIVAVVDTGVVHNHTELGGRLRRGLDTVQLMASSMAQGIELVGDLGGVDTDPEDNVGHGTACAAIIAAQGHNLPPGLAGDCRVLPVRVLGAARFPGKRELAGVGLLGDIDHGTKSAVDLGAKVINMSFGTPESVLDPHDPPPHADVVRYALSRNCVLVAASGNSGHNERYAPASLPGVITVAAVDHNNHPAPFSTGGDHVDIAAPGVRVLSAGLDGYMLVTGTSFAAPFVAAAAGLLVSRAARRAYALDSAAVGRILCASATPWPDARIKDQGVGVLNTYAALRLLDREIDQAQAAFTAGASAFSSENEPVALKRMATDGT